MGGQNNYRQIITTDDWMRDMEKRTLHESRRPQIRTASDLLGPGIGPQAIEIRDWNDEVTSFNGFFYSTPGAQNSPDPARYWMGYVIATEDGAGYMVVYEYALDATLATVPVRTYFRNFQTTPGSLRSFGQWVSLTRGPFTDGIWYDVTGEIAICTSTTSVPVSGTVLGTCKAMKQNKTVFFMGSGTSPTLIASAAILLPPSFGVPSFRHFNAGNMQFIGASSPSTASGSAYMTADLLRIVNVNLTGSFADMPATNRVSWNCTYEVV
jgi:hypothetical protein